MNSASSKLLALTGIQKLIGKRMLASKKTKACFYIKVKADITELIDARPRLKKSTGIKITTNAFY
ncbi:MAG: 2-oxo acid dehydrogenase subunit E2, partial [Phycisphaerae bacterium]